MAAKNFEILNAGEHFRTGYLAKGSATVITAGRMVALSSGLAVEAGAASAAIANCPDGAPAGETKCPVIADKEAEFIGTGDANYAVAQRGTEVDIVMSSSDQLIDVGASSTDVFKISPYDTTKHGTTVGAVGNIVVKINKHIY